MTPEYKFWFLFIKNASSYMLWIYLQAFWTFCLLWWINTDLYVWCLLWQTIQVSLFLQAQQKLSQYFEWVQTYVHKKNPKTSTSHKRIRRQIPRNRCGSVKWRRSWVSFFERLVLHQREKCGSATRKWLQQRWNGQFSGRTEVWRMTVQDQ